MKYKKLPVEIEAWRNVSNNPEPMPSWVNNPYPGASFSIETLEGNMLADPGDYIIKGIKGEIYSCKPDIFELTYEAIK